MPRQKDQNTSIKDFVSVMDKQLGKLKNVDPKHTLKESVNKDNKDNMIKEANDNPKSKTPKTPKQQKTYTTQCEDMSKTATHKKNATERSPLEETQTKNKKRAHTFLKIKKLTENRNCMMKIQTQINALTKYKIPLQKLNKKKMKMIQTMAMNRTQPQLYKSY